MMPWDSLGNTIFSFRRPLPCVFDQGPPGIRFSIREILRSDTTFQPVSRWGPCMSNFRPGSVTAVKARTNNMVVDFSPIQTL